MPSRLPCPRVALVHDWLTGMRGGEAVLEQIARLFPRADLFTLIHSKGRVSGDIQRHPIHTSILDALPGVGQYYRHLLPLMPWAMSRLDVRDFDLVIASSHCVAHGIGGRRPGQIRISYCHTPMRYAWSATEEYAARLGWVEAALLKRLTGRLRRWDYAAAQGVDLFLANSTYVAGQIRQFYGKDACVLHPPVDVDFFTPAVGRREDFYLVVSANVPYKRIDQAIAACRMLGRPLVLVGPGQTPQAWKHEAGESLRPMGVVGREELRDLYRRAHAMLMPATEDFGIAAVEAISCGCPVIAPAAGGALDSVADLARGMDNPTGLLYAEPTAEGLAEAIRAVEGSLGRFDAARMHAHAQRFGVGRFVDGFKAHVAGLLEGKGFSPPW